MLAPEEYAASAQHLFHASHSWQASSLLGAYQSSVRLPWRRRYAPRLAPRAAATGHGCSIHSARLHAATVVLTPREAGRLVKAKSRRATLLR